MRPEQARTSSTRRWRVAEIVGALSLAVDLSHGHPLERSLRTCLLALHMGRTLGLSEKELSDVYYAALLRFAGCTAGARHLALMFGDEVTLGPEIEAIELWRTVPMLGGLISIAGAGQTTGSRLRTVARALMRGVPRAREEVAAHCEVSQVLADRFRLSDGVRRALGEAFERWDGGGVPGMVRGEGLSLVSRIVQIAYDVELFRRLAGDEGAKAIVRERSGGLYDPAICNVFLRAADELLETLNGDRTWDAVLAAEPCEHRQISEEDRESAISAIGDFIDLRSPHTIGHSSRLARIVAAAAEELGLPDEDVTRVRWAAYVHDVGMISVSAGAWEQPGALSDVEWARVRLHPYYTECVLTNTPLADVAAIAALHHERLNGRGYHRGLPAQLLGPLPRLLAAAEVYASATETRPHRNALSEDAAADAVLADVRAGGLDAEMANAVLRSAGHRVARVRYDRPFGLSERELEVLGLVARGDSNRAIARRLSLSVGTVDHHVRHCFTKLGVSTRAAATFLAMQHHLVDDRSAGK
jgi:HD-GYP domain-containing protein (c-di-GMP phosphodiesterase class II)